MAKSGRGRKPSPDKKKKKAPARTDAARTAQAANLGAPPDRMTTHKKRADWFGARAAWPFREPSASLLLRAQGQRRAMEPHPNAENWEFVGPNNVGGRMTCAVCDPVNPETVWAGAAGGGVWRSDDGGRHWRALWHQQETLNVGALAIDPSDPATIYCGTGEANLSSDSYPGVGLYRSRDGGNKDWQLIAAAEVNGIPNIPTRIGAIAIDPFDSNRLFIGGVTHSYFDGVDGLLVSEDAGVQWKRVNFPDVNRYRCHAVLFHPTVKGTIFAAIDMRGSRSGVWKSVDGGQHWERMANGLSYPDLIDRISLAIAPSDPQILYALAANRYKRVLGIFKTTNGGDKWTDIAGDHFHREGQMSYGNTIAVHPTNPNHVICGGVDLHLTIDGGQHWRRATIWNERIGAKNYAHADHHCLLMPASKPGLIYDMNDGGVDVSEDGGWTWTNRSHGLGVTMFYDVDVAPANGRMFGGGTQDNGTVITFDGQPDGFREITGGDGGWMVFDPSDKNHYYTTSQHMWIYRFRQDFDEYSQDVSPDVSSSESSRVWMAILDMDPNDSRTIFVGGLAVWRTKNDGSHWDDVSGYLDGSAISAIEIAQANSEYVYAGTEYGGIFRSTDGGSVWTGDLAGALPGYTVTRLLTDPTNPEILYATLANNGISHLFCSYDAGDSWVDVDRENLPDASHNAIAIPKAYPSTLYVASDAGVCVSNDAGKTWKDLSGNLPTSPVKDLVYHDVDGTLTVATYGRGLWRLKI